MTSSFATIVTGNYTWIFSGIGTSVLGIITWFWRKQKRHSQTGKSELVNSGPTTTHQEMHSPSGNQLSVNQNAGVINQGQQFNFHNPSGTVQFHHHHSEPEAAIALFSPADIRTRINSASVFEKHSVEESFKGCMARCVGQLLGMRPTGDRTHDPWMLHFQDPERENQDFWMFLPKEQVDAYRLLAYPEDQLYEIVGTIKEANSFDLTFNAENSKIRPATCTAHE